MTPERLGILFAGIACIIFSSLSLSFVVSREAYRQSPLAILVMVTLAIALGIIGIAIILTTVMHGLDLMVIGVI